MLPISEWATSSLDLLKSCVNHKWKKKLPDHVMWVCDGGLLGFRGTRDQFIRAEMGEGLRWCRYGLARVYKTRAEREKDRERATAEPENRPAEGLNTP